MALAARLDAAVSRNQPYAGGHIVRTHGRPDRGVHAVQIEIDRGLYMEANRLVKHDGFALVAGGSFGRDQGR